MSGPLAIAAVTAVLRDRLHTGIAELDMTLSSGDEIPLQLLSPAQALESGEKSALRLFLYHIERNAAWTNLGLPSRDSRGERTGNPELGLNLYYMITAYSDQDYDAEIILGAAMQVMHETPGLGRAAIRAALEASPPVTAGLVESGIPDQFEALKITPVPLSADEMSRLWSGFNVPYRPSVAYQVSVVLLASSRSVRSPLPVREPRLHLLPFRALRIARVSSAAGVRAAIGPSSTIRVFGSQLGDPALRVLINGSDVSAAVVERNGSELRVDLAAAVPSALRAGVCGVQVVQPVDLGSPPIAHEGYTSNIAPFLLVPEIDPVPDGTTLEVTCTPPIGLAQRVRLLLNQLNAAPGVEPRAYSFAVPTGNGIEAPATATNTVRVAVANVAAGEYLVRLEVDGAQSALRMNAGRYAGPTVTL